MSKGQPAARKYPQRLGKYEIVNHIATGGMGAVYKALDTKLGRPVAIKILSADVANRADIIERFHREAKAAAKLQHENIVALIDDGEDNGTHFLVLEFVEGTDLYKHIARKGKLGVEEARYLMIQATRGLRHAHEQHIVHRDIKPANFLLTKKNGKYIVKLTDLGLAKRVDEEEFRVTRDGTTVGTIDYISPEQATDSGTADVRSDIYSLGCTYFHMLTGVPPFNTGSLPERLMHHLNTAPPDIRSLNPAVPEIYNHIVQKMLAKAPADRYQTAAELLRDLKHPDATRFQTQEDRIASWADLASAESLGLVSGKAKPADDLDFDDDITIPAQDDASDQTAADEEDVEPPPPAPPTPPTKKKKAADKVEPAKVEPAKEPEFDEEIEDDSDDSPPVLPDWWPIAAVIIAIAGVIAFIVVVMMGPAR